MIISDGNNPTTAKGEDGMENIVIHCPHCGDGPGMIDNPFPKEEGVMTCPTCGKKFSYKLVYAEYETESVQ